MTNKIIALIIIALTVLSCGTSPKYIEEDELRDIITQAIITDALLTQQKSLGTTDTLDYYTTILNRAGYTRADLEYTIREMAARKSNPLNNLFDDINKRITQTANQANYRYRQMERYDTLALKYTTDTLIRKDTLIKGDFKNFTLKVPAKRKGTYTIMFDYQSHNSYDIPTRQIITQFTQDSAAVTPPPSLKKTLWVNRSFQPRQFLQSIRQDSLKYDVLELEFAKQTTDRKVTEKDTSYIKNIRVYFQPTKEDARKNYLRDHTGLDMDVKFDVAYDKQFLSPKKDSLAAGSDGRR